MNTEPANVEKTPQIRKTTYDLGLKIMANLPKVALTEEQERFFLQHPGLLVPALQHGFSEPEIFALEPETINWIKGWESFYDLVFGIKTQLLWKVKIPFRRAKFNRFIIVVQGLSMTHVYNACAGHFPCQCYANNLDISVTENERHPTEPYAIWVKDSVEADENLKSLSANQLKGQGICGETMLERMLHEVKHFRETGKHLDTATATICSGSRYSDGGVPGARWYNGEFQVGWYDAGRVSPRLRAREVITI
ncbi:MAG: hypothetical protein WCT25_03285 [Candidatus Paceibacterota bacterium]|jgi:hypothetical protein